MGPLFFEFSMVGFLDRLSELLERGRGIVIEVVVSQ
jgi:hypothetical protein